MTFFYNLNRQLAAVEQTTDSKDQLLAEARNHLGDAEQTTYAGWKAACRKAHSDVWFDGDQDIASAMVGPKPFKRGETRSVGEWDGDKGSVFAAKGAAVSESVSMTAEELGYDSVSPKHAAKIVMHMNRGRSLSAILNQYPELSRMMEIIAGENQLHLDDDMEEIEDILYGELEQIADRMYEVADKSEEQSDAPMNERDLANDRDRKFAALAEPYNEEQLDELFPALAAGAALGAVMDDETTPISESQRASARDRKFAALAEPYDKITYADKIAGAKKGVAEAMPRTDAEYDERATYRKAEEIVAAIKKTTSANSDIERGDIPGTFQIIINPMRSGGEPRATRGYGTGQTGPGASVQNINAAIDPYWRQFREEGWMFTQPVQGQFTIGIPKQQAMAEDFRDYMNTKPAEWRATSLSYEQACKKYGKENCKIEGKNRLGDPFVLVRPKEGVAEDSLNEGQYEMMLRNGQVKKFVAKDDADAKRIAAGHGAKSVIKLRGGVPAGKIAEQGVAEGAIDDLRDRQEAARRERGEEETKSKTKFVAGRAYGGARQEVDDEDDEDAPRTKAKPAADAPRKRGRPVGSKRAIGAKGPGFTSKLLKKGAIAEKVEASFGPFAEKPGRPVDQASRDKLAKDVKKQRGINRAVLPARNPNRTGVHAGTSNINTNPNIVGGADLSTSVKSLNSNKPRSVANPIGYTEGVIDDLRDRLEAERRERGEEETKSKTKFVAGRAYGGARQEVDDEDDEDAPRTKAKPAAGDAPRKRGRPVGTKRAIGAKGPGFKSKLLKKGAIAETDIDPVDQGEYDQEGDMAHDQLSTAKDAAAELRSILTAGENLPEWVQKKITMAVDYLDTARDYMKSQKDSVEPVAEKAVSKAQRAAAGIAYAAKKGNLPKSELKGASREMAKMPAGELKKFAKTKEKGLPAKKSKEVEETTTAGSVATSAAAPKSKGGMQFGKGIYDSLDRQLEQMIAEGMNVTATVSNQDSTPTKTVSVTADGDDADRLMELLSLAGMSGANAAADHSCATCGQSPCGCAELVDENSPDWPTNTEVSNDALQYSGGLNRPKSTGQTTGPMPDLSRDRQGPAYQSVAEGDSMTHRLYTELNKL